MSSYLLPRTLEVLLSSDETDTLCRRLHRFEGKYKLPEGLSGLKVRKTRMEKDC